MFGIQRPSGKVVLVVDSTDIGFGIAIARIHKNKPVEIVHSDRAILTIEDRAPDHAAAALSQLLDTTLQKVMKEYMAVGTHMAPPQQVYAILHAPVSHFRTGFAEETYPEPRAVTKDMIASLAKKALSAEAGEGAVFEAGVVQVVENGYSTSEPLGKRVTRLGVVAFESRADQTYTAGIERILNTQLPGRKPILINSMRALITLMNDLVPDTHTYSVIDVGGIHTACAVVRKESMTGAVEAPEGSLTIVQRLSQGGLPEATITQLHMLANDTCSTEACQALKDGLAKLEPELVKVFGEAFSKLASVRKIPNAAVLLAPSELSAWLTGFLGRIDFSQFTVMAQPFMVETLTNDHLRERVASAGPIDTGLALACAAVPLLADQ